MLDTVYTICYCIEIPTTTVGKALRNVLSPLLQINLKTALNGAVLNIYDRAMSAIAIIIAMTASIVCNAGMATKCPIPYNKKKSIKPIVDNDIIVSIG